MEIVETVSLLTGGHNIVDNDDLTIYNVVCNKAQAFSTQSPPFSTISNLFSIFAWIAMDR